MLLPILLLTALEAVSAATCSRGYAPVKTAIRRLGGTDPPLSWHDADWQCTVQFPGYEMLKRDFTKLSRAERELCRDENVPLGVQKNRGNTRPYWRGAYDLPHAGEVSSEYLQHKKPTTTPEDVTRDWRGVVNLASSEWWLEVASENTTFRCALCQRARRAQLDQFWAQQFRRTKPYTNAYTAGVRNIFWGQMTVPKFASFLQEQFDKANASIVVVRNATLSVDGARKYSLRVRSVKLLDSDGLQQLLPGFEVSSLQDMDYCLPYTSPLLNVSSSQVAIGKVVNAKLPGESRWISRDCIAKSRGDDDFDAVWDKPLQWVRFSNECPEVRPQNGEPEVVRLKKRLSVFKHNLTEQLQ